MIVIAAELAMVAGEMLMEELAERIADRVVGSVADLASGLASQASSSVLEGALGVASANGFGALLSSVVKGGYTQTRSPTNTLTDLQATITDEIKSMGVTVIRTSELELLYKLADAAAAGDPGDIAKALAAWKATIKP